MGALMTAKEVLTKPKAGQHFVHVYQESEILIDAVCHFVTDQLASTEAAVIVATQAHIEQIHTKLHSMGIDVPALQASEQLSIHNAVELLESFLVDGQPDEALFNEVVGGILRKVLKKHQTVRVYGEMVNVLWQKDEKQAAVTLEGYWNILLGQYSFSLLCAYELDNLDSANYHGAIECICSSHTHFLPEQNAHRLEQALTAASRSIRGMDLSSMVTCISKLGHPSTIMPPPQASLLYLSKAMPTEIDAILSQVRTTLKN